MSIRRYYTPSMTTTLCPMHLSFYIDEPNKYEIERLTPPNGPKSECTMCNDYKPGYGYDYRITEKARS